MHPYKKTTSVEVALFEIAYRPYRHGTHYHFHL